MSKRLAGFSLVVLLSVFSRIASATITMAPTTVDVGNVVVLATGTNTGSLSSDVNGEAVDLILTTTCTGTGTGTFTFTGGVTNLNLNSAKTITLNYTPATRGLRECDVQVVNTGTATVRITFKIRGTGVAPVVGVSPSPGNFTAVRENDASTVASTSALAFAIANTTTDAGQTLNITSVTVTGTNAGDFTVTTPGASSVAQGAGATNYTVTFNPSATGARTATLNVATNDPITPNRTVTLNGTGLGAVIAVTDVAFGNVTWGTTATLNTTVTNTVVTNPGTLTATGATITQTSTWFSFALGTGCAAGSTTCTLSGVTMGAAKTVAIRCAPPTTAIGTQTATVTFTSDTDAGGDSTAAISCTAPSHPNVVVSPTSLAFSTVLVGGTSASQAVTVSNNGNADLMFYFADSGTDPAMFAESTGITCGTSAVDQCTLTPGTSIAVDVTFSPTSRGVKSANLNLTTNDPDTGDNIKVVTLGGTGVAPQVAVTPAPYDYLGVRENAVAVSPTKAQVFAISNASNDAGQTLTIGAVTFSGTNAGDFSVTSAGSSSIAPSTSTNWTVTFNPSAAGARTATMNIATNDPITPNRTVALSGTGTSGVIAVTDVDFTTVTAGLIATSPISVTNSAMANAGLLTVQSAVIAQSSTWFSFAAGNGCTVGSTLCTLTATAAPLSVPIRCNPPAMASGTQTAMVTFTSDSDSGGDSIAAVTCTSGRPDIAVNVMTLDFASVVVGQTSGSMPITITNNGNTNLTFWFAESGTDPTQFAESTMTACGTSVGNQCTVAPSTSMNINVTFSPTTPGAKTATLSINNNDPDAGDNVKTVTLTGNGTAGVASANPAAIDFMNVEVGKTSNNTLLTVTNIGQSALTISSAGLVSGIMLTAQTSEFGVATGTTATGVVGAQTTVVPPNGTVTFNINCHPTSQGPKAGTFRVVSNSFGQANLDVGLACNGQQGVLVVTGGTGPANFYDFGPIPQFQMPAPFRDFTLTNTGNVPVNNIMYVASNKLLGFSILSPTFPISTIAPGGSVTIRVQFYPAAGTDGCVIGTAGDCAFVLTGGWGVTPTNATASIVTIGDGLVAGYDTSPSNPNPLDFGDVRFDQTKDMQVSVINTAGAGGANVGIGGMSITPGTAMTGEFTIVGCCRGNPTCTTIPCPTAGAPFSLPPASNPIVVTVRCAPNNRVAMLDATLTFTSNLGSNPNRVVPLKANSTTAGISVTPAGNVLDFGPTDLDAVPVSVTKRITLLNSGTAALNVSAGTTGGTDVARYAFTAVSGRTVAAGQPFDIDVTYTPTIERPSNTPDVASLTFPIAGVHAGPASVTIQITGFGADRHIGVGEAPVFPDTFKNPGSQAPVLPVTITNNGDAPLNITAAMLDQDPIWTIVNPDPVSIPGRGTHDFNIQFAPVEAGKAPTGHLIITNNDDGMPVVAVDLNGNGIDRRITLGPPVDLGYVGIGLTARLSDIAPGVPLDLTNDSDFEFLVTGIGTDDGAFDVQDMDGKSVAKSSFVLLPHTVRHFDVTFSPDRVGDFNANGILYLEGADANTVKLSARGLYADARGGGGCSTTGQGSRGWLVLVLGAMFMARRRRRARAAAFAAVAAVAAPATADDRDIDLDVFDPTPATVGTTFHVQNADIGPDGSWAASALVTYANNALVIDTTQNDDAPVANRALLTLGGVYVFGGRFEAGAHVPVVLQSGDAFADPTMQFSVEPATSAALADASLHIKARLGVSPTFAYGAALTLTLPTATGEFGGNDKPTARVMGLGSLTPNKRMSVTLNAGGILRAATRFANINQGSGVAFGAGLTYRVLDQMWASGEVFGELIPGGKFDEMGNKVMLNTIEGLAGVHFRPARTMSLGVALGRGVTTGPGTPAFRGILTFAYTPSADAFKPIHPPTKPQPPKDDDVDGVPNSKDECPVDKEDRDSFQDEDGCPETDNDKDGVADAADKCPLQAEDRDRFEDDDGCPEGDNDGDAIDDRADKCPAAAEDKDGFQDQDGCPELDNDKDGLVDAVDKCPNEAEVINGTTDDDGCPDKGNSLVVLSPDRVELLEGVQFKGAKIVKASANVLGQLVATLRAHPEILRLRLTVHVQPTKDAAADQKLSEARAKAVREWLVDGGIDALRLQSSGFGGKQPLIPPTTKGAQEINDRLEMVILERK